MQLHQLRNFSKLLEQEVFRRVGFSVCVVAFLFVLGLALFPMSSMEEVFAEGEATADDGVMPTALINSSLELTLSKTDLAMSTSPSADAAATASAYTTATVKAEQTGQYSLSLQTSSTDLVAPTTGGTGSIISNSTSDSTLVKLSANTWGLSAIEGSAAPTDATVYSPISEVKMLYSSPADTNIDTETKTFTISTGVKVDHTLPAGTYNNTITVSAVAQPYEISFAGIGKMQDMTPEVCESAPIGTSGLLEDTRDGNIYSVKRLVDGECWMTMNLNLIGPITLTPSDSNVTSDFALPRSSTGWGFSSDDYLNEGKLYDNTSTGNGVYYNWYAATAGTGNASVTSDGTNVNSSICPKGWRLPTGGSVIASSDFSQLAIAYGGTGSAESNSTLRDALYKEGGFVYSGGYYLGLVDYVGSSGSWWSSTVRSGSLADRMDLNNGGNVTPQNAIYRYYGFPVRCIAVPALTLADIDNMQDMTPAICEATEIGYSKSLLDTRDGKSYSVKKLADGNCWMTENLRLVGPKTLTSTDSNVASDFTLPAHSTGWGGSSDDYLNKGKLYDNTSSSDTQGRTVYYNWYATTAGTGNANTSGGTNASGSICPKGWRLPVGGNVTANNEFSQLSIAYGGTGSSQTDITLRDKFLNEAGYLYSGVYDYGSVSNVGSRGDWWSSTASSSNFTYYLRLLSSGLVYPQSSHGRYSGRSVRCLVPSQ